jgi:cysteine-rich repeat protein
MLFFYCTKAVNNIYKVVFVRIEMKKRLIFVVLLVSVLVMVGLQIVSAQTSCVDGQRVFKLSGESNSHGSIFNVGNYEEEVCFDDLFSGSLDGPVSRVCGIDEAVVDLSGDSNAHGAIPGDTYGSDVCYSGFNSCNVFNTVNERLCDPSRGEVEVAQLSSTSNAHLAARTGVSNYQYRICCTTSQTGVIPEPYCNDGKCQQIVDGYDERSDTSPDYCPADCEFDSADFCDEDGLCEGNENAFNCPADCSTGGGFECGDGTCNDNEICPLDCDGGSCTDDTNLDCDGDETALSCSQCYCGDNVCDASESAPTCPEDCSDIVIGEGECGNGILDDGEGCDDGNTIPGDGCSEICEVEPGVGFCGDGIIQTVLGEECDDGSYCLFLDNEDLQSCSEDSECGSGTDNLCKPRDGDSCDSNCKLISGSSGDIVSVRWEDGERNIIGQEDFDGDPEVKLGDGVWLVADTENIPVGRVIYFDIWEEDKVGDSEYIRQISASVKGLDDGSTFAEINWVITQEDWDAGLGEWGEIGLGIPEFPDFEREYYFEASRTGDPDDVEISNYLIAEKEEEPCTGEDCPCEGDECDEPVDCDENPDDPRCPAIIIFEGKLVHRGIYFTGTAIRFDHGSIDSDGIKSVLWTITEKAGLNDQKTTTSSNNYFTYSFDSPGQKTITLRVTDANDIITERQIAIVVLGGEGGVAFVEKPFHREVVEPLNDNYLIEFSAEDSFVVQSSGGGCPTINCLSGKCLETTENVPITCTDSDTTKLGVNNANGNDYSKIDFIWDFDGGNALWGGLGNSKGQKLYTLSGRSTSANDKKIDLTVSYDDDSFNLVEENHREFTLGQCLNDGNTVIIKDLEGRFISEINTITDTSGACDASGGAGCCPVGYACLASEGCGCCPDGNICNDDNECEEVDVIQPIKKCADYTDRGGQIACENDKTRGVPIATIDPGWTLDCNEDNVICECFWKIPDTDGDGYPDSDASADGECVFKKTLAAVNVDGTVIIDGGEFCDYENTAWCESDSIGSGECVNGFITYTISKIFHQGSGTSNPNCDADEIVLIDQAIKDKCDEIEEPVRIPCGQLNIELGFFEYTQFMVTLLAVTLIYFILGWRKRKD